MSAQLKPVPRREEHRAAVVHLPRERSRLSLLVWLILLAVGGLVAWSHYSIIDEVTRASGQVIASSRVQVIQAVDGGVLERLRVHEGDRVKKGDVLAVLDETRAKASLDEVAAKRAGLRGNLARLQAELSGSEPEFAPDIQRFPDIVRLQQGLYRERRQALTAEIGSFEQVADLARQELGMVQRLVASGDASKVELLRAQKAVTEAESQISNRRNKYLQEVSTDLAKARDEYEQVEQQVTQRRQQIVNSVIYAPMSGIVKNVKVTTIGGVLHSGDELMQVVPVDDQMIVEAKVLPRDIAQVRQGLPATIKFDAYDYTIFGMVDGEVTYVSADTIKDDSPRAGGGDNLYYRVHIRTTTPGGVTRTGKSVEVLPGMTAQVDIRTGQRSLLMYLLKPVTKTFAEAFRER